MNKKCFKVCVYGMENDVNKVTKDEIFKLIYNGTEAMVDVFDMEE